jgi:hypothetical protein
VAFVSGGRIGGEPGELRAALNEGVSLEPSFAAVRSASASADVEMGGVSAAVAIGVAAVSLSGGAATPNRGLRRAAEAAAREAAKLARRRRSRPPPEERRGGGGNDAYGGAAHSAPSGDFGDFERHTTGFGSRMLARMGFAGAGGGLGATGQGRAEPVLPSMRGRGVGLGAE